MNKWLKKVLLVIPMFVIMSGGLMMTPPPVHAASLTLSICTFIPSICKAIDPSGGGTSISPGTASTFLQSKLQVIVSIVFIGIILISVFIILRAGIKYIQSQGDPGKIGEAQKAITSVFVGIAILFVGIVGLLLVLAFFNLGGIVDNSCQVSPTTGELTCPNSDTTNSNTGSNV